MNSYKANIHLACNKRTHDRLVKHYESVGGEPKSMLDKDGNVLYTTVTVTLFLSPSETRPYESVAIHDKTYSKNLFRLEGKA